MLQLPSEYRIMVRQTLIGFLENCTN